jgi:hypothetical protein
MATDGMPIEEIMGHASRNDNSLPAKKHLREAILNNCKMN